MGKRFKNLKAAIDLLKTDDDAPNPKAPEGTPLAKFQDWQAGERNVSYDRAPGSLPGAFVDVSINPFGLELDGANLAIVPLSSRAQSSSVGSGVVSAGNIAVEPPATAKKIIGFQPAKATVYVPTGGTSTTPVVSKLTGKKYLPSNKASYSFPYGQKTGVTRENAVRAAITAAVVSKNNSSVSFRSEKL